MRLKTEGAFHTYYMVAAAQHYRGVLDQAGIAMGDIKVLCNYTGGYHDNDAASVKTRLFFQLFHPVLWLNNLHTALADGITTIIEFGGGIGKGEGPAEKRPNLEGMIKKAQRGSDYQVDYFAAINVDSIQATAQHFRQ
jgi:[acyl-carrier-protein] S-malonyltransferase